MEYRFASTTASRFVRRSTTTQLRRQRRPSCYRSSRRWLWTCLAVGTGPVGQISSPLASAFALRYGNNNSGCCPKGLSATRNNSPASSSPASFTTHSSLSELLREFDYDALILDQFGVLHNGKNALEGTIACVETIAKGKTENVNDASSNATTPSSKKKLQLIVLSNTSSPAQTTLDRLRTKLGFDESCFCGAVTSGEEAARHIRKVYGTSSAKPKKFVWCTWDATNENVPDPNAFLELCGANVQPTVDIAEADFVIAHGSGAIRGYRGDNPEQELISMGSFLDDGNLGDGTPISELLEKCADRELPLICANPDMVVQYHDGSLKHMPGKIAQRYQEIFQERKSRGDPVKLPSITIYGKPHTEHFDACLRVLGEQRLGSKNDDDTTKDNLPPLKVAHVGDSLHHDIAGANAAGIPSIFIVGGIHAEELTSLEENGAGILPSKEKLKDLFSREGIAPTHVLPVFRY